MAIDTNKYSIYAAANADKAQVDWGKVATDMSTTLSAVAAAKQKQRDQLDLDTQTAIETLSQVADVNSADAQALLLQGAEMSKQNLLIQSDLMKRNKIKPKDFMLFMQQQKAGYANLSAAIKNWDKYFSDSQLRLNPNKDGVEASGIEIWAGKSMESFGNLKNKTLWTNPATGQMQLVEMMKDKNGSYTIMPDPNTSPEKFMNPNAMKSRMNIRIDKKSLSAEVKKLVEPLAKIVKQTVDLTGTGIRQEGFRFTNLKSGVPDDPITKEDESTLSYVDWIESQVDSLTATSNDQVQILTNNGYTIAASESAFFRDCASQGGNCDLSNWIKGDLSSGELVWNHIISEKDLKAEKDALITQRDALDDGSEKNILTQQIKEIDENLKNNKIQGGNILVNGLSDSQQEKSRQIAFQAIDSQIDNIEEKDDQPSANYDPSSPIQKKLKNSKHRVETIGLLYSSNDGEEMLKAMKSLLNTSGDRFAEFTQKEIKDGNTTLVTEINIPYINPAGNKSSKSIKLHELKKGADEKSTDPNDYVAVTPLEFAQGMYELLSMGDGSYASFNEVKQFVNSKATANRDLKRTYLPDNLRWIPPREAIDSSTTIGSGTNAAKVSGSYTGIVNDIGDNYGVWSGDGSEDQKELLINGIKEALKLSSEARGEIGASSKVTYQWVGNTLTLSIGDKDIDIVSINDAEQLMSRVNTAVDKALGIILPKRETGKHERNTNVDPLDIN
tara:strand:+ start:1991 stop:4171 length:2181 start_codon:yes stop_codon:yes gene_type:complete